jgi:WhiB family redox-sensing transcriptional regulator
VNSYRPIEVMAWAPEIPGWNLPDPGETEWQDQALCAQVDPELFFVEKGGTARPAKRICRECPVRAECLEYALESDQGFGIWGGLSERERRRMKPAAPERDPAYCLSGRHLKTPQDTGAAGACLPCRRDAATARAKAKRLGAAPSSDRRLAA